MKTLENFINEKLKVSKDVFIDEITYETFMEEFKKMNNPDIYFGNHIERFNNDYPKFQSWNGMNSAYKRLVGKKFKSMYLLTNLKLQTELHADFKRSINGTTGIIIENTDDLYNFLGEEQVFEIYDIIKKRIADQNI